MPDTVLCHTCRKTLSVRDFPILNDFNSQHLRSLHVPNNVEAVKICRETTEADLNIAELDKEIESLRGTLKELETQRKALERCRDEARSLLAPIRKLPPEVLELAFDAVCLSSNADFGPESIADFALDITINTARAWTLNLSQVCSVWRELVRARPSLWSSIWVDLSHRNGAFKVMEYYLNQSRDAPLTLFVTAGELDRPSDDDTDRKSISSDELMYESRPDGLKAHSWEALDILFLFSRKWKDVTMCFSWAVFTEMSEHINFNVHCFDQLVCLNLDWEGRGKYTPWNDFVSLFASEAQSPRLRSLSLSEYEPRCNFSLCRITTLGPMRGWSTSGMIHALTKCHNVDSFTVILPVNKARGMAISPRPLLIKARSLDIEGERPGSQSQGVELLNSLVATQLENLTLRRWLEGVNWQLSLLDFISRSRCPLQTLTLHHVHIDRHLLQLLSLVPTLISLTMEVSSEIDDTLFNGLVATAESSIAPRLQQFDLVYHYPHGTENQQFSNTVSCILALAESRAQSSPSVGFLKRFSVKYEVSVTSDWDLDSEFHLRLQCLNEAGMKASIKVVEPIHYWSSSSNIMPQV